MTPPRSAKRSHQKSDDLQKQYNLLSIIFLMVKNVLIDHLGSEQVGKATLTKNIMKERKKKTHMHAFCIHELRDAHHCLLSLWLGEINVIPHTQGCRVNFVLLNLGIYVVSLRRHKSLFKLPPALFSQFAMPLLNLFRFCEMCGVSQTLLTYRNQASLWKCSLSTNKIKSIKPFHCLFNYIFDVVKIWMSDHMND